MRNIISSLFLFLINSIAFTIPTFSEAHASPTNVVYRVSTISPDELEGSGGIWPRSGNPVERIFRTVDDSLIRHLEASSIALGTSNFVSTWSFEIALVYGVNAAVASGDSPSPARFYLYEIRPGENFFDVNDAFLNAQAILTPEYRLEANRLESLRRSIIQDDPHTAEYVALGGIRQQRIIRYAELTRELLGRLPLLIIRAPLSDRTRWMSNWQTYAGYDIGHNADTVSRTHYPIAEQPIGTRLVINATTTPIPLSASCLGVSTASTSSGLSLHTELLSASPARCPGFQSMRTTQDLRPHFESSHDWRFRRLNPPIFT